MATKVFSSIHTENLVKIAKQEGLEVKESESKSKIVSKINSTVEEYGVSQLAESLKLLELQEVCEDLDIDHKDNNPKHKVVLKKRLIEKIIEDGTSTFLSSLPQAKLEIFLNALGMKAEKGKEAMVEQLTEAVYSMGAEIFLSKFDVPFLKQCAKDLKIKCPTDSKAKIVNAIVTQTAPEREEKDMKIVFSAKKLPIKKGITYQDIFQWYYKEELVEYCKENGLKVSGKKKEVIERILAYLDGDKENTMAKVNVNKEEPKQEKKEEKPKKEEKKTESKKSKAKEPEPEPEVEKEAEQEEEEKEAPKESPKNKSKKTQQTEEETEEQPKEKEVAKEKTTKKTQPRKSK